MAKKYPTPKRYHPINPDKYIGDKKDIWIRSSWEHKFFLWCDKNSDILYWNSEDTIIPYFNSVDNKWHRYFVDAVIQVKSGKIYLVEIKPYTQTLPPKIGKKRNQTYINEVATYETNQNKWEYAREYCKKKGWEFVILTEKELFNK